jgi:glycerate dehydrogenase
MLGVMLDRDTVDCGDIDLSALQSSLPLWKMYGFTPPGAVADRLRDATVVVTNKVRLDAPALAAAPKLRLVCLTATGTNNVDLATARRRDIVVCNVTAYATSAVVQHVFAMILALTTRLLDYRDAVRAGRWQSSDKFCLLDYPIRELANRKLGVVGYGELGSAVTGIARAFGMQVLIARRAGGPDVAGRLPLDALLQQVDVLSLHCPLTDATRGLIGAHELSLMKPEALLINTARGGIVDEQALASALRAGLLAGAGIDVLTEEPPQHGSPLLAPDIPNLIVTPHTAWASSEARQRVVDEVAENIRAFLHGRGRNRV